MKVRSTHQDWPPLYLTARFAGYELLPYSEGKWIISGCILLRLYKVELLMLGPVRRIQEEGWWVISRL